MAGATLLAQSCSTERRTSSTIGSNAGNFSAARTLESSRRSRSTITGRGKSQRPRATRTLFTEGISLRDRRFTWSCILIPNPFGSGGERFCQSQRRTVCAPRAKSLALSPVWPQRHKAVIRRWSAHLSEEFCALHLYRSSQQPQLWHKDFGDFL